MNLVFNIVGFQFGWFAAVLGGAHDYAWAGTIAALIIVAVHLLRVTKPYKEALLIAIAALIGFTWESMLVSLGVTTYPSGTLLAGTAPHWIVAMWMLFATTLNISLRWLRNRIWLAVLTGAISGPMAFYAGHGLGGVEFSHPVPAMVVLAAGWAIFVPLLVWLSVRMDGTRDDAINLETHYV